MVTAVVSCLFAFLAAPVDGVAAGKSTQQLFEEGKSALYAGDKAKARELLQEVLRRDPRHNLAQIYLTKAAEPVKAEVSTIEGQMAKVMVPSVEFSDANLGDVLEYISEKTDQLTNGSFRPNIVYKGERAELDAKKVTLKLSNIPMLEVLRYVGDVTGTEFKYTKYAIEGMPERHAAR